MPSCFAIGMYTHTPELLADAGGRAPDANAVRRDDATHYAVASSRKLTIIAAPNQIAEERRKECPRNLHRRLLIMRPSPGRHGMLCTSTGIAACRRHTEERYYI